MGANATPGLEQTQIRANRKVIETTCSICGRSFELAEMAYSCRKCGGYHHLKCWDTHHDCSRVEEPPENGAPASLSKGVEALAAPPALALESDQRTCPICKEIIKKDALKCRFCGTVLERALREEMERD